MITSATTPPTRAATATPARRRLRSWLIVAKVIAVALYVGGLAAVTFIWVGSNYNAIPPGDPRRQWLLALVGRIMVFFVIPLLIVAMVLGVSLLLRHPREFLQMRWLHVKLVLLLLLVPAGHFWCRAQSLKLRDAAATVETQAAAARALSYGLVGTLLGSLAVVVLGRRKPRFGQSPLQLSPRS